MSNHKLTRGEAHIDKSNNRAAVAVEHRSGPLPAADEIAKYEATLPGAAHRIIVMAEKQQLHVLEMQKLQQTEDSKTNRDTFLLNKLAIDSNSRYNFWRLVSSVVICSLVIGAGFYAIYRGAANAGATIISIPLAGIILAYISDKISPKSKDNKPILKD